MPRPCSKRFVGWRPGAVLFKPAGTPVREVQQVDLTLDGLEALRLADLQGEYQEAAATQMKISRATFARIVESARRKVADALVHGKAILIQTDSETLLPHPPAALGCGQCPGCRVQGHGHGRGRKRT